MTTTNNHGQKNGFAPFVLAQATSEPTSWIGIGPQGPLHNNPRINAVIETFGKLFF